MDRVPVTKNGRSAGQKLTEIPVVMVVEVFQQIMLLYIEPGQQTAKYKNVRRACE